MEMAQGWRFCRRRAGRGVSAETWQGAGQVWAKHTDTHRHAHQAMTPVRARAPRNLNRIWTRMNTHSRLWGGGTGVSIRASPLSSFASKVLTNNMKRQRPGRGQGPDLADLGAERLARPGDHERKKLGKWAKVR